VKNYTYTIEWCVVVILVDWLHDKNMTRRRLVSGRKEKVKEAKLEEKREAYPH